MRRRLAIAIALLAPLCGGCSNLGWGRRPVEVERQAFSLPSGLRYEVLFLGTGPEAQAEDVVAFDYTAWLEDGTRIDSTLDRGVPVEGRVADAPLAGLAQGIVGMRAGGRRRLHVPPELAYGAAGVEGLVPPHAALVFDVHLLSIEGVSVPTPSQP
jgi:FKBP-type peptidyl-prolyl cis-trans isomerase